MGKAFVRSAISMDSSQDTASSWRMGSLPKWQGEWYCVGVGERGAPRMVCSAICSARIARVSSGVSNIGKEEPFGKSLYIGGSDVWLAGVGVDAEPGHNI